jgi:5-methylcytosine-specific restriction enzyme subunit McrC
MIRLSVREWERIPILEASTDGGVTRAIANQLLGAAGAFAGRDSAVLVDRYKHLQAQQVVGVVATPTVTLEILPKIDTLAHEEVRANLVHMLAAVFDLDVSSGRLTELGWQRRNLLEVLIRLFCEQLFGVVRRGLPRRYVNEEADLAVLRGRLDLQRQLSRLIASPDRLACRYQDLSPDIALNQIMKAAVSRLLQISRSVHNQRALTELAFAFSDVTAVPVKRLPWTSVVLDRSNTTWASVLNFARLILGQKFQTTNIGEGNGFSLLFEMNVLFEEYVGRVLRSALGGTGLDVRLQGPFGHILSEANGTPRFRTRPDVVVSSTGQPALILDTKWKSLIAQSVDAKRGVSQADIYQMIAYARVYRCKRLMLLYPHRNELACEEGRICTYKITGADDLTLSIASISLSNLTRVKESLRRIVLKEIDAREAATGVAA